MPVLHASVPTAGLSIFINRHGGTYVRGYSDSATNHSSVLGSRLASTKVNGFGGNDDQWQRFVSCLEKQFDLYQIEWLSTEPVSGSYMELVVGDVPETLGLEAKTVGIAPMDKEGRRILPKAIAFVFSERIGAHRPQRVCEVAAQEIGHALGLDHSLLCQDPMSYLKGCGTKTFQNRAVPCGEQSPRVCKSGEMTQNTVQLLKQRLGIRAGRRQDTDISMQETPYDLQAKSAPGSQSPGILLPGPVDEAEPMADRGAP